MPKEQYSDKLKDSCDYNHDNDLAVVFLPNMFYYECIFGLKGLLLIDVFF